MKRRIALISTVYAVALSVGVLVMSGQVGLAPFAQQTNPEHTLRVDQGGTPILLCSGYGFACYGNNPFYQITQPTTPCSFGGCVQAYAPFDTYPYIRQPVYNSMADAYRYQQVYSPSFLRCPGNCVTPTQTLSVGPQLNTDPFYNYVPATLYQPRFGFGGSFNSLLYTDPVLNVGIVNSFQLWGYSD